MWQCLQVWCSGCGLMSSTAGEIGECSGVPSGRAGISFGVMAIGFELIMMIIGFDCVRLRGRQLQGIA